MKALVSVVVPTFNRAYCLSATIRSALSQSYRDLEVIVVDDGSTDGTRELVEAEAARDSRVRYVYQENQGVSAARNLGMRVMRGQYMALLDSDDLWSPWKVALQMAVLDRLPDVGMVWTEMEAVDGSMNVFNPRYLRTMYSAYQFFPKWTDLFPSSMDAPDVGVPESLKGRIYYGDLSKPILLGNLVHTSTVLMRRERMEKVGGFREDFRFAGEDYEFHLRTCRLGPVAVADVPSIQYVRGRSDQLTRREYKVHVVHNFLRAVEPYLTQGPEATGLPAHQIAEVLADAYAWHGECLLRQGDGAHALPRLVRSLRYKPVQPRVCGLIGLSLMPKPVRNTAIGLYHRVRRSGG